MRADKLRKVGRLLVTGSRQELVKALDDVIEPKHIIWERISDVAIGYVADIIISGRADILQGAREALDQ